MVLKHSSLSGSLKYSLSLFLALTFLLGGHLAVGQTEKAGKLLDAKAFYREMEQEPSKIVLDVRTPEEFEAGHLEGALNINFHDEDFAQQLEMLEKGQPVFVYCKGGTRSKAAIEQMQQLGFGQIYDLKGGTMAWENNNLPLKNLREVSGEDEFTKADFDKLLAQNPKLLIDYYADWCAPCKKMAPYLAKLEEAYKGSVKVHRLNVDHARSLTREMNIEGIPIVAIYRDGEEIQRVAGYQSEEDLTELLEQLDD